MATTVSAAADAGDGEHLRAGHRAARLLPERHPRAGDRRRLGGLFEDNAGDDVTIETSTFNAGPEAVEALFAEASTSP